MKWVQSPVMTRIELQYTTYIVTEMLFRINESIDYMYTKRYEIVVETFEAENTKPRAVADERAHFY